MTVHFPVTEPISKDADIIMQALNARSEEIKSSIDHQSLFKKTTLIALKALGLTSGVVAVASIPVTAIVFAITPLTIGTIALCTAISCLALYMFLDPRSPGELIIKDQWRSVFEALRNGNGKQILETCQELAKQKEKRLASFNQCLGSLDSNETIPFFHKTCLVGYLQIALDHLKNNAEKEAKSNAHLALSHFGASGFSSEIEDFIKIITHSPKEMNLLIETHQAGEDLHALDYLIATHRENLSIKYSA